MALRRWATRLASAWRPLQHRSLSTRLGGAAALDRAVLLKYNQLPLPPQVTLADYVWIDGSGASLRSRTRALDFRPRCVEQLPQWSLDGSQTRQSGADGECGEGGEGGGAELRLLPVAMYNDPLRGGGAKLVLCETYSLDYRPVAPHCRTAACEAFADTERHRALFGFRQEYVLTGLDGTPLGWPARGGGGELPAATRHYCGVGARHSIGREVAEAHARACLYAGVALRGFRSSRLPAKWKFETRLTGGIKAPDDVVVGRYLLQRIAAEFGLEASLHPTPVAARDGSGLHVKFTTAFMAEENGFEQIASAVLALAERHREHMRVFAGERALREFTMGTFGRKLSVRIPADVQTAGCGHLEDLRPAANCDPYAVCSAMLRTVCC